MSDSGPIRVFIADDHAIVRKGIQAVLEIVPDIDMVGEAENGHAGEDKIFPAIKAGALGYHLKDSHPEELVQAIREVHRGESSLHPLIARKVLEELSRPSERPLTLDPLTPREVEVLRLVAQGLENAEIAERLVITEATVRTHVSNITGKLHVASRTQAALYALREGLASLDYADK
jgi:NarL family two-component system response regulator LiaR